MIVSTSLLRELVDSHIPIYPSVTGASQPITLRSLAGFFYALAWAWALLLSFTGWGRLAARLFRIPRLPASVACGLGIATVIFIGGWLNLVDVIYRGVIFGIIAAGVILYISVHKSKPEDYRWVHFWKDASVPSRMLLIAALLILLFRVAGTVRLAQFDVSDDSAAYLALPQKMLAVHHFAADPFSERRITSGLGGSYLLQDFVLSATSLPHIAMADRTLGLILLAGVLWEIGIAFELSALQISLLEFLVYLVPQETFNLTFIVLPVSLLLAVVWLILRTFEEDTENILGYAFTAGVIGGATASLKSTYLPIVVALSILPYLLFLERRRPKLAFQLFFCSGFGILVVLISWMAAMKLTSGTYLFPVLGRGLDYSRHSLFQAVSNFPTGRSIAKIFLQGIALLILACIQLLLKPRTKHSILSFGILVSSALCITALNYTSSADSIWRYNFPQFFIAVIVFYAATSAASLKHRSSMSLRAASYIGIVSMLSMMFYYDIAGRKPTPFQEFAAEMGNPQPLLASLSGRRLTGPALWMEYQKMEAAIPPGDSVLENVAYSFLLDYRSHNILIMDWPGAAAPLPGWPFGQDSSHVSQYLMRNSIHYVIFDYRYALQNDAGICQDMKGPYRFSEWVREQIWMNVLTDNQLNQLKAHYQSIYDDGKIAVIDLAKPRNNSPADNTVWTIDTNVDMVCSQIAGDYFAGHPKPPNMAALSQPDGMPASPGTGRL